jgi:putative FmdB family regulatory protein
MPIYEYECKKCGKITEALQGFNDPPLKRCKNCKGKLVKLISLSSFQLQGTGWYSTDYAKGPGIPPHANDLDKSGSDTKDTASSDNSTSATEAKTSSSDSSTYESIKKDTAKAKSKGKGA